MTILYKYLNDCLKNLKFCLKMFEISNSDSVGVKAQVSFFETIIFNYRKSDSWPPDGSQPD